MSLIDKLHISKSLLRLLILYGIFSMILLLMITPIYIYIYNISEQNELERCETRLANGVSIIDNTVTALQNVVETTGKDIRFQVFKYETTKQVIDPLIFTELQQVFSCLILPQSQVADAGIIFTDLFVLTRQRSFYSNQYYHFYDQFIKCDELEYGEWLSLLYENSGSFIPVSVYSSLDYGAYDAITYVLKWPTSSINPKSIFYATFPIEKLLTLLADEDIIKQGYVRIYDAKGNVMIDHQYEPTDEFRIITGQTITGLHIEIGIPAHILHAQLIPVKKFMLAFTLCILLAAIALIFIFAYKSSVPMRRLIQSVYHAQHIRTEYETCSTKQQNNHSRGLTLEYDGLASSLFALDNQIDYYQQTITHQKELIQTQIMEKAICRGLYGNQEVAQFNMMFPDFPHLFSLALFCYEPESLLSDEAITLQLKLIDQIRKIAAGIYAFSLSSNTIIMILPLSKDNPLEVSKWNDCLKSLRRELMAFHDLPVAYAVSDVFRRPRELSTAYQQIQHMDSLSQYTYINSINGSGKTFDEKVLLPLNFNNLQTLYEALSVGNLPVALSVLGECTDVLLSQANHAMLCRHIYSLICHLLVQVQMENPKLLSNIQIPNYDEYNQKKLLRELIPACFSEVCGLILAVKHSKVDDVAITVVNYIQENLFSPDLYVNSVADYFDISAPTLQKLVKKITGQTFSAYVEEQRLSKAYYLLMSTRLSVKDVSEECGFINTNSFYKAFKRKYRTSPSSIIRGFNSNNRAVFIDSSLNRKKEISKL